MNGSSFNDDGERKICRQLYLRLDNRYQNARFDVHKGTHDNECEGIDRMKFFITATACILLAATAHAASTSKLMKPAESSVYRYVELDGVEVCELNAAKTDCTKQEYADFYRKTGRKQQTSGLKGNMLEE